jgi:hypothetical protein
MLGRLGLGIGRRRAVVQREQCARPRLACLLPPRHGLAVGAALAVEVYPSTNSQHTAPTTMSEGTDIERTDSTWNPVARL